MSAHLGLLAVDLQPVYTALMPEPEAFLKRTQFAIEAATLLAFQHFLLSKTRPA